MARSRTGQPRRRAAPPAAVPEPPQEGATAPSSEGISDRAPPAPLPAAGAAPEEDVRALARRFADGGRSLFFDVGTLREPHFTGIPNVAANLAREIFVAGLPCRFFIGDTVLRPEYVRFLLETWGGSYFSYHHQLGQTVAEPLLAAVRQAGTRTIGLFPAEKPFHRLFGVELQVLHDFSTVVTPYFHLHATTELHGASLLRDIASNDLSFCVSEATAEYLRQLCPDQADRVVVALNGVRWPDRFRRLSDGLYGRLAFEPYVVILGTIEPRKNLDVVFRALARDRGLLRRYRWIFMGKPGWMFDFGQAVARHLGSMPRNFTYAGFVSEFKKYALLRYAAFSVYPSLFEGFGLPIAESFSLGTPCAHSLSSSMPEVAGQAGFGFRPESAEELLDAIYRLEAAAEHDRAALQERCRAQAAQFSWERMLGTILSAMLAREPVAARASAAPAAADA
jgi:glycosyltransferase involved in cell wall biosynthesis